MELYHTYMLKSISVEDKMNSEGDFWHTLYISTLVYLNTKGIWLQENNMNCENCIILTTNCDYFDECYKSKKMSKKVLTFEKVCVIIYKLSARKAYHTNEFEKTFFEKMEKSTWQFEIVVIL